jgi:hypothetical protein
MSLQVPQTAQLARPKAMFYFYSPLQTVFSSPTVTDTTSVSSFSPSRTTLKTYNLNLPSGANTIRVIVYGYVSNPAYWGAVYVNIDGTDVASTTTTNTTETLLIDYIGSITPGSHTVRIDGAVQVGYTTLYITRVYVITGIGLTSTTLVNILQFTVTYQLIRSGDIRYSPGVRVFIWGNRKTTASMTLTIPEATSVIIGRNNLGAGDDNDKAENILAIVTGPVTLQEGGEFTINVTLRGAVGASGDVIIITRVLARAQLRREIDGVGEVRIYERGVVEYAGRTFAVSVPGSDSTAHFISRRDIQDRHLAWHIISGWGANVVLFNFRIAVVTPIHFTSAFVEDNVGNGFLEWVQLVVWG